MNDARIPECPDLELSVDDIGYLLLFRRAILEGAAQGFTQASKYAQNTVSPGSADARQFQRACNTYCLWNERRKRALR